MSEQNQLDDAKSSEQQSCCAKCKNYSRRITENESFLKWLALNSIASMGAMLLSLIAFVVGFRQIVNFFQEKFLIFPR